MGSGVERGKVGGSMEGGQVADWEEGDEEEEEEEDEDVLEIPVFVRVEWEGDAAVEEKGGAGGREKREVAFWCVLGVGRVRRLEGGGEKGEEIVLPVR